MKFQAAVIRDWGVKFAVVIVLPQLIQSAHSAVKAQMAFAPAFPGVPIVLMAQDPEGAPMFHGRKDLIALVNSIQLDAVRWQEYSYGR
ncbi:MAG: hypothetical protein ABIW94_10450 [Gemmatimonadaceae bacterium]